MTEEKFFRSSCNTCGLFIDSAYCEEVEGQGYKCGGCGSICSYDLNEVEESQKFFVRMSHIDGVQKDKAGQITLKRGITNFIKTAGEAGWLITEYTPITSRGNEPVVRISTTK